MQTIDVKGALSVKKDRVKDILKQLKGNENAEELAALQKQFESEMEDTSPIVIAMAEQEMLKEGFTFNDLKSACDVHLKLFAGQLEKTEIKAPDGHPVKYFQNEHRGILKIMEALRDTLKLAMTKPDAAAAATELEQIKHLAQKLLEAENHNVRQENTLFPLLERHGVTAPPAIMWEEHVEMKETKKQILKELARQDEFPYKTWLDRIYTLSTVLLEKFFAHSQKENHILYQTALDTLTEEDWKDVKEECDNLGYFEMDI